MWMDGKEKLGLSIPDCLFLPFMPVTKRIEDLVDLLRRGRSVTRAFLESRWGCSPKTVQRTLDLACSPEYNHRIRYDRGKGRYILDADAGVALPRLWFSHDEAAAVFGLAEWLDVLGSGILKERLNPVRKRLDLMLQAQGVAAPDWAERIRLLPMQARKIDPETLMDAARAVLRRKRARFLYKGAGEAAHRPRYVSPQRLVRYRDNWSLDAWCHERRGFRQFALSRLKEFTVTGEAAQEFLRERLDAHFAGAYGIFAGPARHKARLVFEGDAARIVSEEAWHPKETRCLLSDGRLRLEFPCGDVRELARDVMRFADEVTVEGPEALREAVAGMVKKAAERLGSKV